MDGVCAHNASQAKLFSMFLQVETFHIKKFSQKNHVTHLRTNPENPNDFNVKA